MSERCSLLHHLYVQHPDHVIVVRPPSLRVDGTGPTEGYLFCRDCDGDVDLSAPCAKCAPAMTYATRVAHTYETGGNERPDAWDRLREARDRHEPAPDYSAWCHCSCSPCFYRGDHHPNECPVRAVQETRRTVL